MRRSSARGRWKGRRSPGIPRHGLSSSRPSPSTRHPRCGVASCISSSTAARTRVSCAPSRATAAASTCSARPSSGRRRASVRTGRAYPTEQLKRLWQLVLLQQFHDILPGTSIAWVHQDAERNYAAIAVELEQIIADSLRALVGEGHAQPRGQRGPARACLGRRAGDRRGGCGRTGHSRSRRTAGSCSTTARACDDRRPGGADVDHRPGERPRGRAGRSERRRLPVAPGHPDAVGCLGHRRALPPQRHRPPRGGRHRDRRRRRGDLAVPSARRRWCTASVSTRGREP